MSRKYKLSGITWDDVESALDEFEKATGTLARFVIERQERCMGQPMGLKVTMEATGYLKAGAMGYKRTSSASWPTYAHKTMPGLMLYLVHALHESLLAEAPRYRRQVKTPSYPPG